MARILCDDVDAEESELMGEWKSCKVKIERENEDHQEREEEMEDEWK
jgi:hypothetical protein